MSHCGPLTAKCFWPETSLRICTPLLPSPALRRTWKVSSKSLYFFLLHRKVLNFRPLGDVSPTRAPSLTDQYSVSPSQPSRSLPLKNFSLVESLRSGASLSARAPSTSSPAQPRARRG